MEQRAEVDSQLLGSAPSTTATRKPRTALGSTAAGSNTWVDGGSALLGMRVRAYHRDRRRSHVTGQATDPARSVARAATTRAPAPVFLRKPRGTGLAKAMVHDEYSHPPHPSPVAALRVRRPDGLLVGK